MAGWTKIIPVTSFPFSELNIISPFILDVETVRHFGRVLHICSRKQNTPPKYYKCSRFVFIKMENHLYTGFCSIIGTGYVVPWNSSNCTPPNETKQTASTYRRLIDIWNPVVFLRNILLPAGYLPKLVETVLQFLLTKMKGINIFLICSSSWKIPVSFIRVDPISKINEASRNQLLLGQKSWIWER